MAAQSVNYIDSDVAEELEREFGCSHGTFARDREATDAEKAYLSIPKLPMLAWHVEHLPGKVALVIYEQNLGKPPIPHLDGANFSSNVGAVEDIQDLWGGLTTARQDGLQEVIGEPQAVLMTGWVSSEPNRRFSWSVPSRAIRNLFQGAPRPLLVNPILGDVPSKDEGPSPGKCIQVLEVSTVVWIHSVVFQGVSTFLNRDGAGLVGLAVKNANREEANK